MLFANNSFQLVLSTPSFFFLLITCLTTWTVTSAKPFFFLATISSASNHLNQFLFPIQPFHWVSLPSPPPPCNFFFCCQDFPFPLFSLKSLGGSHVEESNCPFLGFALPMSRFQIILLRVELYVMLKVMYPNCEIYTVYRWASLCLLLAPSKVVGGAM